jgi:hypothetical protein
MLSNFPKGFPNGVALRNVPVAMPHPGKVFWVSSTAGSNGNRGTYEQPFSTIDYAVGRCRANKGDIIFVMPGHVETVTAAGGLDLDVAGIVLIGLGNGNLRPQINFTTAVGADMNVSAANITMVNFRFTGGIDALTGPIDVNASDFELVDIITEDVTGQATDFIVTDANASRLRISGWQHRGASAAGADTAISMVGGDDIVIEDFSLYGNFAVAGIENVTTAMNRVRIGGGTTPSYIWTENAADVAITMVAATTGSIGPNINIMLQDNAANITEAVVGAACQFYQPINIANLAGEVGMQTNITASTDA